MRGLRGFGSPGELGLKILVFLREKQRFFRFLGVQNRGKIPPKRQKKPGQDRKALQDVAMPRFGRPLEAQNGAESRAKTGTSKFRCPKRGQNKHKEGKKTRQGWKRMGFSGADSAPKASRGSPKPPKSTKKVRWAFVGCRFFAQSPETYIK